MIIGILLKLFMGYIEIEVEGYYIERFINLCAENKILIWNIKKEKGVRLYLYIGIKDLKKIKKICKETKCKVKIKKKNGIPFIINKYKKRKIFILSIIIIAILIAISSMYIWNIEIEVEGETQLENINSDLKDLGIQVGMLKNKLDVKKNN